MTELTYGIQIRKAFVGNGKPQFRIDMHLTDKGVLPDTRVFLKSITEDSDPKKDMFKRVCRVGDLATYSSSREEALRRREALWRDGSLTVFYTDISLAKVAADFLKERVNDLVASYTEYTQDFATDPDEIIIFPQQDMGVLKPLISDYRQVVEERQDKQNELIEQVKDCAALQESLSVAEASHEHLVTALESIESAQTTLTSIRSSFQLQYQESTAIGVEVQETLSRWSQVRDQAEEPAKSSMDVSLRDPTGSLFTQYTHHFKPMLPVFQQELAAVDLRITQLSAVIGDMSAKKIQQEAEIGVLKQQVKACEEFTASLQTELESLERREAALLDHIQDLCPDFTPEST